MWGYDTGFHEVAERIWLARYEWYDVNITLVGGDEGLLMIDTHSSTRAAHGVIEDLRRAGLGEVVAVVNTHEHFDHTFGNHALRTTYGSVPIHATAVATANVLAAGARFKQLLVSGSDAQGPDPRTPEILATELVEPDRPFEGAATIDLGGRLVELVHPGRGHTGGDLLVRVPDADVLHAGDLLEESAPPVYGDDCFPLEWPETVTAILRMSGPSTAVIPGHGVPADRAWTESQHADIAIVAQNLRDLVADGVPMDRAAQAVNWPWPTDDWRFAGAIRRGYEQLGALGAD
ncbi:MAG: MBL fold metallo-hydrolase [Nocardioides sp.]|uniref:MBL fold metallo-hydrolase n=1 Tax=Nocardioides sp. TaxID=35761 RepID=UPI0039E23519